MEVTGVVLRQSPLCFSSSSSCSKEFQSSSASSIFPARKRAVRLAAFSDRGHVRYYDSVIRSEVQEKTDVDKGLKKLKNKKKKQQLKLLKGLSRDLSTFSQIGFGLDSDRSLLDQVNGTEISGAAELLLERLQKLRNEEKELKMKRKEEKARLKAERKQNKLMGGKMSSSSSSESSSDSECGEVVDMSSLKRAQTNQTSTLQPVTGDTLSPPSNVIMPVLPPLLPEVSETEPMPVLANAPVAEEIRPPVDLANGCCSGSGTSCVSLPNLCNEGISSFVSPTPTKKVEVCMGGKCKKSGAGQLLEEFQRAVGIDIAVSGCKCMGKCRDGPNVRVMSGVDGGVAENTVKSSSNPLCIGVGLEDVDVIVANFLGENQKQLGFAA